jgi:hypothetical protein
METIVESFGSYWAKRATGTVESMSSARDRCPVCAATDTSDLLQLDSIPTNNAILCETRSAARDWPTGALRLAQCRACGFVFNAAFDPRLVEYSSRIEETQAFSPHFIRYAQTLAGEWIDRYGLRGRTVLEVGCGKAEFLSMLCEMGDNRGIGYDPAVHFDRVDKRLATRLTLVREFFGDEHLGLDADAVVCRHTLEHIPGIDQFLAMLHRWARARSHPPVVLIEVPDVERVFDEVAFWDVYYEHCSYFTADTLRFAFERAGFEVLDVRRVYDGQYLVLEARPVLNARTSAAPDPQRVETELLRGARFRERWQSIAATCRDSLQRLVDEGERIVLWGGGAKAVGLLTSLDVGDLIEFTVDVNPNKHGKFLVGTGHEVRSPEELKGEQSLHLIVMNPVYVPEISATVAAMGVDARISSVNDLLGATSASS